MTRNLIVLIAALLTGAPQSGTYPLASTVAAVRRELPECNIDPTRLARGHYLDTIEGIVDFFRRFQTADGRILDPYLKREVQYSTPCYAWAASALVVSGRRADLAEGAAAALELALVQLAENRAADRHGDFFTFPALHAFETLRERMPPERRARWERLLRSIEPARVYRNVAGGNNWNVVAASGEFLRSKAGFTDIAFFERHVEAQLPLLTAEGLYRDPNVPMAYDHFPRHFLEVVLERGYAGRHRGSLDELLERGAWTSLLVQSPLGEIPAGGRSAGHQWNEAMQCVTYEVRAARAWRAGDRVAARAFKRAARLALGSVRRWIRPSGELWIVKNRFDPSARHGFESYSSHSQYNLLAASMLATAWLHANEEIPEAAAPADVGGFVAHLPSFHKVVANAGGLYIEIDTAANRNYDTTGLIRVHRAGIDALVGPSSVSAAKDEPLSVGAAWRLEQPQARMEVEESRPERVRFTVTYRGSGELQKLVESYDLTPERVRVAVEAEGTLGPLALRFPALVFDGARASRVIVEGSRARVELGGSRQTFEIVEPAGVRLTRSGRAVRSRNGYLEAIEARVDGRRAVYTLALETVR